jgi:hypothetical protein
MSEYYEIDKPFSRENWNKLIRDLNEVLTDGAPGGCEGIDPLEEVDPEHIWTKKDVEEVRDKIKEMCADNEFDADLDKPWHRSIIDEIEDQMNHWCGCAVGPFLLHTALPALGVCWFETNNTEGYYTTLASLIDGLQVCNAGYDGIWTVTRRMDHYWTSGVQNQRISQGLIDCSGSVVYTGTYKFDTMLWKNYFCFDLPLEPYQVPIQEQVIEDAQATVDDWTAQGFFAEYYLNVSCRPPKFNDCGGAP